MRLMAIPIWADMDLINDMYAEAAYFGETIDHIVPLKSDVVCGLHVEANLQLLSRADNSAKRNRHWPQMWEAA